MFLYLSIFLVTILFYLLRSNYDLIRAYWLARKIKGPPALPLIGNGLLFMGKSPTDNFFFAQSLFEKYGTYFKICLGPELNIAISDPKDVEIILYNIAKHPEVQQKCYKEVIEIFGTDKKEPTTISKLNQLSYLELVVKESLRLFPSVPVVGRLAMEDIQLTKGRIVPKGAQVYIPIFSLGHSAEMFEDPEEFRPERFLEERSMEKKNPFAYIPFSAGARNCIGQKFAMYEIKSIISKILRNFNVSLAKDSEEIPELCAELILRPSSAINFHFEPRI